MGIRKPNQLICPGPTYHRRYLGRKWKNPDVILYPKSVLSTPIVEFEVDLPVIDRVIFPRDTNSVDRNSVRIVHKCHRNSTTHAYEPASFW